MQDGPSTGGALGPPIHRMLWGHSHPVVLSQAPPAIFVPIVFQVSKIEQRRNTRRLHTVSVIAAITAPVQVKRDKMRDLEDMAAKLEAARTLPPGPDRGALIEQIGTFRIELAAIAAKRKLLQAATLQLAALVRASGPNSGEAGAI
jgi:hypothetical protein